jgi:hypothetical protein
MHIRHALVGAALGTTGLVLGGTMAISTPAQASSQPVVTVQAGIQPTATRCPSGWFCVWPRANFGGSWKGGASRKTCYTPFGGGRSVSNQLGARIRVYGSPGCRGSYFDLSSGYHSNPTPFRVRSVRTY